MSDVCCAGSSAAGFHHLENKIFSYTIIQITYLFRNNTALIIKPMTKVLVIRAGHVNQ